MDIEKVKGTIRQLLNLANNDGAAAGEIENAMRFAARLMEQHQLKEEDLSEVDDILLGLERAEMKRETVYCESSKKTLWEGQVAMFACKLVGGVEVYANHPERVKSAAGIVQIDPKTGEPRVAPGYTFYGVAEDVLLAQQVYSELTVTIAAMARLKYGGVFRGDGRSYCEGFVAGLFTQLRQDEQKQLTAAQASGGTALMVVQSRNEIMAKKKELAKDWLKKECGVKLGSARSYGARNNSHGAYSDGRSDGARHNASVSRRKRIGA